MNIPLRDAALSIFETILALREPGGDEAPPMFVPSATGSSEATHFIVMKTSTCYRYVQEAVGASS